jgi:hypothetical protein
MKAASFQIGSSPLHRLTRFRSEHLHANLLHDLPLKATLKTGIGHLQKIQNPLDLQRPLRRIEDTEPCKLTDFLSLTVPL